MAAVSLAINISLMLIAVIGLVLYVALVITIPVVRLLDWLAWEQPEHVAARSPRD